MSEILKIYKRILSKRQKQVCVGLLVLQFFGSLLECLGLSLIIPAIAALSEFDLIGSFPFLEPLLKYMDYRSASDFVANVFALMCGIYLLKNLYLAVIGYVQIRFIGVSRLDAQKEIMEGTLHSPYLDHMQKDTPEMLQRLDLDIQGAFRLLDNLLILASECMVVFALALLMAVANLPMTLAVLILYSMILLTIQWVLKPYLSRESIKSYRLKQDFQKWLLQTVHGIKIIKAEKLEKYFIERLKKTVQEAGIREIRVTFIQTLPRRILEMISICGMLGIACIFLRSGVDTGQVLNQLSVFALVSIRMLPSVSRINGNVNTLNWNLPLLRRTEMALLEVRSGKKVSDKQERGVQEANTRGFSWNKVELKQIHFQYPDAQNPVLENLNLTIHSGEILGIMGLSGAGKTTLVDIVLGLLEPQKGQVSIDGANLYREEEVMKNWSASISYIPQNISLLDGTIRENILFGKEDWGEEKIWEALKEAQLMDYVRNLPEGLETHVGEGGIRLSGGQRQRIGIARAFYKQADILVLDESTSALDYETEQKIIQLVQIWKQKKTVLMITHRLEALSVCDRVIAVSGRKAEEWSKKI